MRLALKLVLVFMLVNIALAGVCGYLAMRDETDVFREEVQEEAVEVDAVMAPVVAEAWKSVGDKGMSDSVRRLFGQNPQPLRVRWVWFEPADEPDARPEVEGLAAVVIAKHELVDMSKADGSGYLVIYWPVEIGSKHKGGLEFAHSVADLTANKRTILVRTEWLIGGMALISVLLAIALGIRFVGRPLDQLIAKARRISEGDFEGPVHIRSRDELSELAENLNSMCANLGESQRKLREETAARIAAIEKLRHADRLKTVGRLASGIAHELGTPLNVVAGRAGLIGSGKLDPQQVTESAAAIRLETDKMTRIIRQLLDFARSSTPHKQPADLRSVVRQTIDMLESIAEKRKVRLNFPPGAEPAVAGVDAGQIQQVLTNLTMNAIEAMPQGGQVEFRIERRKCHRPKITSEGVIDRAIDVGGELPVEFFAIEVRDEGVGIAEEHIPQLFEPFFTTKEVGAGTGLGLSIAYGIVQEHGGWIDVTSLVGKGSCFTVFLPAEGQS